MARFSGDKTMDDREAAQYHDRFVSSNPADRQFDSATYHDAATEYLGKLPDDQFNTSARSAVAEASPEERKGLLGTLMGALGGTGGGALAGIASRLGLGSSDPNKMSDDDATRVLDYARKEKPEVLRQTVEEKPWFVRALGSPVVLGALAIAAAKYVSNQRNKAAQSPG